MLAGLCARAAGEIFRQAGAAVNIGGSGRARVSAKHAFLQLIVDRAWRLSGRVPWHGARGAVRVIVAGAAPLSARCASTWSRWLPWRLELRPRTRRLRCKHCSSPLLRRVAEVIEDSCAVRATPPHCLSQPAEKCSPQLKRPLSSNGVLNGSNATGGASTGRTRWRIPEHIPPLDVQLHGRPPCAVA